MTETGTEISKDKEERTAVLSKRRKVKKMRRRLIYICVAVLFAVMVGFSVYHIVALKMEQKDLRAENQKLTEQKKELKKELSQANDLDNIEKQARTKLHMIKPGETLYLIQDDGN